MTELKVEKTRLDSVLVIHPPTQFEDFRGTYTELYSKQLYHAAGIKDDFVQDDTSFTKHHVLRGIHGDAVTAKLTSCLYGEIYCVIVNNDPASSQYRQWQSFVLSDRNRLQLYIPPKFGNSFLTLSEFSVYHYKQTSYYDRSGQFTLKWNDPLYKFEWPIDRPILSERDS